MNNYEMWELRSEAGCINKLFNRSAWAKNIVPRIVCGLWYVWASFLFLLRSHSTFGERLSVAVHRDDADDAQPTAADTNVLPFVWLRTIARGGPFARPFPPSRSLPELRLFYFHYVNKLELFTKSRRLIIISTVSSVDKSFIETHSP